MKLLTSSPLFQAISEFKKGKVEYRVDKTGIVHIPFGKVNFPEEDLLINLAAVIVCFSFLLVIFVSNDLKST